MRSADFCVRFFGADFVVRIFRCGFFGADFSVRIFRCGFFGADFCADFCADFFASRSSLGLKGGAGAHLDALVGVGCQSRRLSGNRWQGLTQG